jgi:hypothetical protein
MKSTSSIWARSKRMNTRISPASLPSPKREKEEGYSNKSKYPNKSKNPNRMRNTRMKLVIDEGLISAVILV